VPEPARLSPTTQETLSRLLTRLGGTPFEPGRVEIAAATGLLLPAARINAMRRETCALLLEARVQRRARAYPIGTGIWQAEPDGAAAAVPPFRVHCRTWAQAEAVLEGFSGAEAAVPAGISEAVPAAQIGRVLIEAPRFVRDEDALRRTLAALRARGFGRLLCQNPAHIVMGRALGFEPHGGFGLNVFNSGTAAALAGMGLASLTASFELKAADIRAIHSPVPLGLLAYGRLPLMLLRRCPFGGGGDPARCRACPGELSDRTGRRFPVLCRGDHRELLNADTLWLAGRRLPGAFRSLYLHGETPEAARGVVQAYLSGGDPPEGFTRGLYWRGVE
ncbi:MAG: DUF3656 domain-containing protein, partial [Oscillospiraceae bacterium]|nr:DUF3656 domain-containing protein [Oscillospiraceae bacterium]